MLPDVEHWIELRMIASLLTSLLIQIHKKGIVVWLARVTDEECNSFQ